MDFLPQVLDAGRTMVHIARIAAGGVLAFREHAVLFGPPLS
jgi:hypothetical protein